MACQRSTQTASNCQSNVWSPFSRVPSLACAFFISPHKKPYKSFDDSLGDSPSIRPFNAFLPLQSESSSLGKRFIDNGSAEVAACRFNRHPEEQAALLESLDYCEPFYESKRSSHQRVSTHEFVSSIESFGSLSFNTQLRSFHWDQQLCSAFLKVSSAFRVALLIGLINLIGSIVVLLTEGLKKFGASLSHFGHELYAKLGELKRFSQAYYEASKQAVSEQFKLEQTLATISKQLDIINYKQADCRSFFKLWPFLFVSKLVLSKFARSLRAPSRNGAFQLFIILCISTTLPASANLKVSVQGDILLGGIFPVHQKGKFKDCKSYLTDL